MLMEKWREKRSILTLGVNTALDLADLVGSGLHIGLGDRQARINRSEGRKQEMINKSEGERQKRINEAEGLAAEIKAIAEATAISIEKVAAAIVSQNGEEALRLNMSEKYLSNLGKLASNRTELILPMDLSKPDEILENIGLGRPG